MPARSVAPRRSRRAYTETEFAEAVRLAQEIGVIAAADRLSLPESTLRHWVVKQKGARPKRPMGMSYPRDLKRRVLASAQEKGIAAASLEFQVPKARIQGWVRSEGVTVPRKFGEHAAWDITLGWLTRLNPLMEEWRSLAHEWLAQQTDGLPARMTALSLLFKAYIIKQGLTTSPAELLSRFYPLPSSSGFPDTRHGKVCRNYACDFLDWVLRKRFSELDGFGHVFIDPLSRNPLSRASFAGDSTENESRFSALPYSFLVECRQIIAQGRDFKDWTWAQAQLGVEIGLQGGVAPEWFEVPQSLIDEQDPDCVWRRRVRARAAGGPRYEMWSPVRWVAQLAKIILPLRTLQVRLLDSGEADTWSYHIVNGVGTWKRNAGHLRCGTDAKPVQQGIFRRPSNEIRESEVTFPAAWANAVLYVNTNKTADSKKSGNKKGYILPWVVDGGLESDVFYWLYKLREWQSKYNPLARRTSWKELDGRHILKKSDVQIEGFPDSCFLFRLPEERSGKTNLPIADGMLDHTWYAVLEELENRLRLNGKVNRDGTPIQLVHPNRKSKRTYFPPHSVRVSLVTALADAGVPLTILMRLVGHSRLAMTIYYRKRGEAETVQHLSNALEQLKEKGAAVLTDWLKNVQHKKLLQNVIGNYEGAFLGAIPKNPAARNPAGWMPMSLGMCLVGGNASALEEAGSSVGGCYNGGPNIGTATKSKFAPVPGGAKNCIRCRWLVTAPVYLPSLVDHCNVQLYHFEEARMSALTADRRYQDLVAEQIRREKAGEQMLQSALLEDAQAKADSCVKRFNERAQDVVASMRMIERCRIALKRNTSAARVCQELLAVGSFQDVEVALGQVDSELEQLELVCESVAIYPEVEAPAAVLRRSQLMDAALALEGLPPVSFALNQEDQLLVGNELMTRLGRVANPNNPSAGKRRVIEIIDARECLSKHLGLNMRTLLADVQQQTIVRRLPA